MATKNYNGDLAASRKLTDEEAQDLRSLIIQHIHYAPDDKEDVDDLLDYTFAMVSNGKSLDYIVGELVSMEMDVCQEATAHKIAMQIATYLEQNVNHVVQEKEEAPEEHHRRVISLKSSGEGNALTMSGALGASRERGKKGGQKKAEEKKKANRRNDDRRDKKSRNDSQRRHGNDNRSSGRGGGARMNTSEAFERLSGRGRNDRRDARGGRRDDRRDARGGRGGGGRGETWRGGGRDMGRGGGRGDMGRGGRGDMGQRGAGRGRNSPGTPMSGNRRTRDEMRGEEDFIPAGRGGRGDGRFGPRGGRRDGGGGRGGRRPDYEEGNKRQRVDDGWGQQGGYYDESWGGYDEGYDDYNWRGGGRRGGRGGRGRGRGRSGRGFSPRDGAAEKEGGTETAAADGEGEAAEAAAGHPSPLVAASFGGRGYRGRGGRGRGRGGRSSYRAQVATMIASKSWVRPKTDGEGGDSKGGEESKQNGDDTTGAGEG